MCTVTGQTGLCGKVLTKAAIKTFTSQRGIVAHTMNSISVTVSDIEGQSSSEWLNVSFDVNRKRHLTTVTATYNASAQV